MSKLLKPYKKIIWVLLDICRLHRPKKTCRLSQRKKNVEHSLTKIIHWQRIRISQIKPVHENSLIKKLFSSTCTCWKSKFKCAPRLFSLSLSQPIVFFMYANVIQWWCHVKNLLFKFIFILFDKFLLICYSNIHTSSSSPHILSTN